MIPWYSDRANVALRAIRKAVNPRYSIRGNPNIAVTSRKVPRESNLNRPYGFQISLLDSLQGQVLIDFQTLLTLMSGDQLNLTVGKPLCGKVRNHLMAKGVRMYGLDDAG